MPDTVGTVLAGEAEARAEAIVVSGEMLKDLGGAFWNSGEWQVRVEDEAGNKVCALTFSADRQHLHERRRTSDRRPGREPLPSLPSRG